jgi:hypothetical protein
MRWPGGVDVAEHAGQLGAVAAARHAQFGEADDGLQRRAQLVADVGDELLLAREASSAASRASRTARSAVARFGHVHEGHQDAGRPAVGARAPRPW